jgi:hypothetical protein
MIACEDILNLESFENAKKIKVSSFEDFYPSVKRAIEATQKDFLTYLFVPYELISLHPFLEKTLTKTSVSGLLYANPVKFGCDAGILSTLKELQKIRNLVIVECQKHINYTDIVFEDRANGGTYSPQGYIYAIYSENENSVKIGFSEDPKKRLQQLAIGNSGRLEIFFQKPALKSQEKSFHQRFAKYRLKGEWFSVKQEVACWLWRFAVRKVYGEILPENLSIAQIEPPLHCVSVDISGDPYYNRRVYS